MVIGTTEKKKPPHCVPTSSALFISDETPGHPVRQHKEHLLAYIKATPTSLNIWHVARLRRPLPWDRPLHAQANPSRSARPPMRLPRCEQSLSAPFLTSGTCRLGVPTRAPLFGTLPVGCFGIWDLMPWLGPMHLPRVRIYQPIFEYWRYLRPGHDQWHRGCD